MEIDIDRSQQYLFPPCVSDWVPASHPARLVAALVEQLRLKDLGFRIRKIEEGRPNYASNLLLQMWIYAYMKGVRSTREVERLSYDDVGMIWLTSNKHPDHSTLSRFFQQHESQIKEVFRQVVKLAQRLGLVGLELQAVDGTKIKAMASNRSTTTRAALDAERAAIDAKIERWMAEVKANDAEDHGEQPRAIRLPEELADEQKRAERIRKVLEEDAAAREEEKRKDVQPPKHISGSEPASRMMVCGPEKTFGYNAQAVADSTYGIIVAADVFHDCTDQRLLATMVREAEAITGSRCKETIADKGYATIAGFAAMANEGFEVTVALPKDHLPKPGIPFHASNFTYDEEADAMVCPLSIRLPYLQKRINAGTEYSIYRCKQYATCPKRAECCAGKRGRHIWRAVSYAALVKQQTKYISEDGQKRLSKRAGLIEPVFARIKQHQRFRRWSRWRLQGARSQWWMIVIVENLRIIAKAKLEGRIQGLCPT